MDLISAASDYDDDACISTSVVTKHVYLELLMDFSIVNHQHGGCANLSSVLTLAANNEIRCG
jgi:hypothetical protein